MKAISMPGIIGTISRYLYSVRFQNLVNTDVFCQLNADW